MRGRVSQEMLTKMPQEVQDMVVEVEREVGATAGRLP